MDFEDEAILEFKDNFHRIPIYEKLEYEEPYIMQIRRIEKLQEEEITNYFTTDEQVQNQVTDVKICVQAETDNQEETPH